MNYDKFFQSYEKLLRSHFERHFAKPEESTVVPMPSAAARSEMHVFRHRVAKYVECTIIIKRTDTMVEAKAYFTESTFQNIVPIAEIELPIHATIEEARGALIDKMRTVFDMCISNLKKED